jgi:hypothetical protein
MGQNQRANGECVLCGISSMAAITTFNKSVCNFSSFAGPLKLKSPIFRRYWTLSELSVLYGMIEKQKNQALQRDAFTMRETAQKLGISYMSVFRLVQRGLLKPSVALRVRLFSQKEIDRFLRESQAP